MTKEMGLNWSDSSSRPAGFRQTLKIGDAEYGFCWIPAGEFEMGSPETEEGRQDDETLRHATLTRGFWLLETPTTQALYKEIMGTNPSKFKGDDLPVENVSWRDATKFCETLTKRLPAGVKATLPSETQWEYACRAGTKTAYWHGDAPDFSKMNYYMRKTSPVKNFAANPWGLYDMHGNVWEWTSKTARGGSWRVWRSSCCRSAQREVPRSSDVRRDDLGFRVLLRCDEGEPGETIDEEKRTVESASSKSNGLESNATDENQNENADASLWRESPTRPAGFRQTLRFGVANYGFCWIPAGEFDMGSPESETDRGDFELLHHVKLTRGFWMLETPTTQRLYREIAGASASEFRGGELPAETLSWDDALEFCEMLTKRLPAGMKAALPTEAQWEYACRAGTKTAFWYGDFGSPRMMNYSSRGVNKTTPVKTFAANPWGLYDMHGNVWEWTSGWFGEYPSGTAIDPAGPVGGVRRVCRGGSWDDGAGNCRSANRLSYEPSDWNQFLGFRFLLSCD